MDKEAGDNRLFRLCKGEIEYELTVGIYNTLGFDAKLRQLKDPKNQAWRNSIGVPKQVDADHRPVGNEIAS